MKGCECPMKRLTFHVQIRLSLGIGLLCFILASVVKQGLFMNAAWIIYGLFWIINPVWPQSWDWKDHNILRRSIRIAGVLAIIIGLITRFGV